MTNGLNPQIAETTSEIIPLASPKVLLIIHDPRLKVLHLLFIKIPHVRTPSRYSENGIFHGLSCWHKEKAISSKQGAEENKIRIFLSGILFIFDHPVFHFTRSHLR